MASPWVPYQRSPTERPWVGMAMLAALPLLSLILIRMLWSGSSLWFLTVGIILLGAAAVVFLARRPAESEHGRNVLASEQNRVPLVLTGIGVLFLAMLLLPNFAGGSDDPAPTASSSVSQPPAAADSEVSGVSQAPGSQQPIAPPPSQPEVVEPAAPETYTIQAGDTLWDVALSFDVTVEAIIAANSFANPEDLEVGQEIVIPSASEAAASDEDAAAADGDVAAEVE